MPKSPNQVDMPLQHREFSEALARVKETTRANVEGVRGNSNYWCIVSAGAPGIGKFLMPFLNDLYRLLSVSEIS